MYESYSICFRSFSRPSEACDSLSGLLTDTNNPVSVCLQPPTHRAPLPDRSYHSRFLMISIQFIKMINARSTLFIKVEIFSCKDRFGFKMLQTHRTVWKVEQKKWNRASRITKVIGAPRARSVLGWVTENKWWPFDYQSATEIVMRR